MSWRARGSLRHICSSYFLVLPRTLFYFFFFFNDTATTEIYTLSLHDALPIFTRFPSSPSRCSSSEASRGSVVNRSEEHTSELQSRLHLVCRLLLEKKKKLMHSWPA